MFDIAQYGSKTQERIIAAESGRKSIIEVRHYDGASIQTIYPAGQTVLDRALTLQALCDHPWCKRSHAAEPYGTHQHASGFDLAVCETCNPPSLAPSGTD